MACWKLTQELISHLPAATTMASALGDLQLVCTPLAELELCKLRSDLTSWSVMEDARTAAEICATSGWDSGWMLRRLQSCPSPLKGDFQLEEYHQYIYIGDMINCEGHYIHEEMKAITNESFSHL